nr:hypothetical protein [Tanacetum cinerariifolium]
MEEHGRSMTVLMEFSIVKCCSHYNVILGRTRMRSFKAVGSTIHSMIKFPIASGVVTLKTSGESLKECKQLRGRDGGADDGGSSGVFVGDGDEGEMRVRWRLWQ